MSIQLTDEPTLALSALQDTIRVLKCNKQSRVYFDSLNEQLSELLPQLAGSLESMKEEAAYGQTLKQSQLKGLQVTITLSLVELAAANWQQLLPGSPGGCCLGLCGTRLHFRSS